MVTNLISSTMMSSYSSHTPALRPRLVGLFLIHLFLVLAFYKATAVHKIRKVYLWNKLTVSTLCACQHAASPAMLVNILPCPPAFFSKSFARGIRNSASYVSQNSACRKPAIMPRWLWTVDDGGSETECCHIDNHREASASNGRT